LTAACVDADADLTQVTWSINGGPSVLGSSDQTPAAILSTLQVTFFAPGTYMVTATPNDVAGSVGTPTTWTITVT
jgi:hypothetical protein